MELYSTFATLLKEFILFHLYVAETMFPWTKLTSVHVLDTVAQGIHADCVLFYVPICLLSLVAMFKAELLFKSLVRFVALFTCGFLGACFIEHSLLSEDGDIIALVLGVALIAGIGYITVRFIDISSYFAFFTAGGLFSAFIIMPLVESEFPDLHPLLKRAVFFIGGYIGSVYVMAFAFKVVSSALGSFILLLTAIDLIGMCSGMRKEEWDWVIERELRRWLDEGEVTVPLVVLGGVWFSLVSFSLTYSLKRKIAKV